MKKSLFICLFISITIMILSAGCTGSFDFSATGSIPDSDSGSSENSAQPGNSDSVATEKPPEVIYSTVTPSPVVATEKSQEVIYSTVTPSSVVATKTSSEVVYSNVDVASSLTVLGDVYGNSTGTFGASIDGIRFVIGLNEGRAPVDFSNINLKFNNAGNVKNLGKSAIITSQSSNVVNTYPQMLTMSDYTWGIIDISNGDKGSLLENNEQFTIYTKLSSDAIAANEAFTLEIKPPVGSSYAIKRTAPAKIQKVNILY